MQNLQQIISSLTAIVMALQATLSGLPTGSQLAQVGSSFTSPSVVSVQTSSIGDTSNTETINSVSWQSGDIIVVIGGTENGGFQLNTPTATGLSFSLLSQTNSGNSNSYAKAYLWVATASGSGSGDISSTRGDSSSGRRFISAYVVRGSSGVGNTNTITNSSSRTITLTRSGNNSAVIGGLVDWNALSDTTVDPTPSSGGRVDLSYGDGASYGVFAFSWADQGSAGATNYGITNQTGTPKN